MPINKLEYSLIHEVSCSPEPLHILIGGLSKGYDLKALAKTLIHLVATGYLRCSIRNNETKYKSSIRVTLEDLDIYFRTRKKAKESLAEYPEICPEYYFYATARGIKQLRLKDRPIPIKNE